MTAMHKQHLAAFNKDWITKIALDHGKSEATVRALICNTTQFKAHRAPNLRNTIIHDCALKANEAGNHLKVLTDLQMELEDDIEDGSITNIDEAEKQRLIKQLIKHWELHRHGARSTNKAVAVDAVKTELNIRNVLLDLYERTGVRGFAVFSRGNPDDSALPHSVESDGSMDFFEQVFDISEYDLICKFEQWSCTQDGGACERNNSSSMHHQIVDMIIDGLCKITKIFDAVMSYTDYDVLICECHKVELAGWPVDKIPMQAPSKITTNDHLHKLRDGLRSGAIHWVHMTKSQLKELDEDLEMRREANGGAIKKHAKRSDKGKKRTHPTQYYHSDCHHHYPGPSGSASAVVAPAVPTAIAHIPTIITPAAPAPIVTPAAPVLDEAFWDSLPNFDLTQFPTLNFNYVTEGFRQGADPAPEFPSNLLTFAPPSLPSPPSPHQPFLQAMPLHSPQAQPPTPSLSSPLTPPPPRTDTFGGGGGRFDGN
ncbi:hypothetical protein C8R43DRAFT_947961 [Mycena crocata]|nr:hypothetical protein C8R43DRAFT_947961 [Mycena crocata]